MTFYRESDGTLGRRPAAFFDLLNAEIHNSIKRGISESGETFAPAPGDAGTAAALSSSLA